MEISPLYPCDKPCSTETHNKIMKQWKELTLFFAFVNRIMMESQLRISNPVGMLSVLQSNRNSVIFAIAKHKAQIFKILGVKFYCIFLSIKLLERNNEWFDVNLSWQFCDILISFKMAAFVDVRAVTSSNTQVRYQKSYKFLLATIL